MGRNSPNVEINFDQWFMSYTKDLKPIDGPLATDRPHYFKAYGAYTLPFGLTVGAVLNAMSGTPVTEYWNVNGALVMPYNRGNLGRTPFLWFANLYAEYRVSFGKTALAFNRQCGQPLRYGHGRPAVSVPDPVHDDGPGRPDPGEQLVAGNGRGYTPNPMFNKDYAFFSPISARLGMRFSF